MLDLLLLPGLARFAACGTLLLRSALGAALLRHCQLQCLADTHLHSYTRLLRSCAVPLPALAAHVACGWLVLWGISLLLGLAPGWAGFGWGVHFALAASWPCAPAGPTAALPGGWAFLGGLGIAFLGGGGIAID